MLCSLSLENQHVVPKALKTAFIPSIMAFGTTKTKGTRTVVGATFMAPVVAVVNLEEIRTVVGTRFIAPIPDLSGESRQERRCIQGILAVTH